MVANMTPVNNSYIYSWSDVKNTQQSWFANNYFYFGSISSFEAPYPGYPSTGYTKMYIGSNALDPHINHAISENEIRFMVATFGDNDYGDCFQSGFYTLVEVDVGY